MIKNSNKNWNRKLICKSAEKNQVSTFIATTKLQNLQFGEVCHSIILSPTFFEIVQFLLEKKNTNDCTLFKYFCVNFLNILFFDFVCFTSKNAVLITIENIAKIHVFRGNEGQLAIRKVHNLSNQL